MPCSRKSCYISIHDDHSGAMPTFHSLPVAVYPMTVWLEGIWSNTNGCNVIWFMLHLFQQKVEPVVHKLHDEVMGIRLLGGLTTVDCQWKVVSNRLKPGSSVQTFLTLNSASYPADGVFQDV